MRNLGLRFVIVVYGFAVVCFGFVEVCFGFANNISDSKLNFLIRDVNF